MGKSGIFAGEMAFQQFVKELTRTDRREMVDWDFGEIVRENLRNHFGRITLTGDRELGLFSVVGDRIWVWAKLVDFFGCIILV